MDDRKSWLRATRERVGLSQRELAQAMGNTTDMVKKWENPAYSPVPQDVADYMRDMLKRHREAVEASVEQVEAIEKRTGRKPRDVTLSYFRSQYHYDEYGRDRGSYGIVNARSRDVAAILEHEGYSVRFVYPEERSEAGFTALANTRE